MDQVGDVRESEESGSSNVEGLSDGKDGVA